MNLSWADIYNLADEKLSLLPRHFDLTKVDTSYNLLLRLAAQSETKIYGLHSGYGFNVKTSVNSENWSEHQSDLLNYLCVGSGPLFQTRVVRRALRLQAYKLAQGFSGIHPETFTDLIHLSNATDLPEVPIWGSLGASGDLVPMAHAVSPLFSKNEPRGPRDVISLVNTNSMMASLACEIFHVVEELLDVTHQVTGLVGWALGMNENSMNPWSLSLQSETTYAKLTAEHNWSAAQLYIQEKNLNLAKTRKSFPIQEKYSLRCAPQILGNCRENLDFAKLKIKNEALALADNPLISAEFENPVAHGGLFYTSGLATAADLMNDTIFRCCEILDRQVLILMDSDLNHGLPENLGISGGDHCKGLHQLISSLMQVIRSKSTSSRSLSFSCESNNQDVVPCSMNALHLVHENVTVAHEITQTAKFVAERACWLAAGEILPQELQLKSFKEQQRIRSLGMDSKKTQHKGERNEFHRSNFTEQARSTDSRRSG